jgi:hypothetical protein
LRFFSGSTSRYSLLRRAEIFASRHDSLVAADGIKDKACFFTDMELKFTVLLRKLIEGTEELREEEKRACHVVTKDLEVGFDTMLSDQEE